MAEADKRDRLAAALRANLRRRKQPVEPATPDTPGEPVGTADPSVSERH